MVQPEGLVYSDVTHPTGYIYNLCPGFTCTVPKVLEGASDTSSELSCFDPPACSFGGSLPLATNRQSLVQHLRVRCTLCSGILIPRGRVRRGETSSLSGRIRGFLHPILVRVLKY